MVMTGSRSPRSYSVRAVDVTVERSTIERLLAAGFPESPAEVIAARFSQHYLDSPAGRADCMLLEMDAGGEAAGMQGLLRRRFESASGALIGSVMADYVVLPAHRALGPAIQLLRGAVEHAGRRAQILYGFPNKKAGVVFSRAGLGPRLVMTRYAHLIRSEPTIRRKVSPTYRGFWRVAAAFSDVALAMRHHAFSRMSSTSLSWEEQKSFGHEFDEIWSQFERAGLVTGERSAQVLHWRFRANVGCRISVARDGPSGSPVGYVVWSVTDQRISIHDMLCVRPTRDLAPLLVGFVTRARKTPAELVYLEFAGPPALRSSVQKAGFTAREESPVHLVVPEGGHAAETLAASLYLTGFDRDTD